MLSVTFEVVLCELVSLSFRPAKFANNSSCCHGHIFSQGRVILQ